MASENIGYHTRLYADNTQKVTGGSFGGDFNQETIERLVKAFFTVTVKHSCTPVFVDQQGREVTLYFSVDPGKTQAGIAAQRAWRQEREREERARRERVDAQQAEIETLLDGMSHEEAIRRLKAK